MRKNFDYLGNTFQLQLINQIILDKDFSNSIIDVIEGIYFDNKYFKIIIQMIKEYYKKYETTPNFETLEQIVKSEISQELIAKIVLDTLTQVKDAPLEGTQFVQEKALKFCKQQELQKAMDKAQKIITEGDFESYDKVEGLVRDALQVGEIEKGQSDVFSDLELVLEEDYRHPIPMGISGIDNLLKGGLAKGEIGVILAPTGVGKALPISEPVLTPKGWVNMGNIMVGDEIVGSDGMKQYVLGVYPQGVRRIFKVQFSDNTTVNCDEEHLWSVNTLEMRKTSPKNNEYIVVKTSDMIKNLHVDGVFNYKLPTIKPIQFDHRTIEMDPYFLGILLNCQELTDGCVTSLIKESGIITTSSYFTKYAEYEGDIQNMDSMSVRLKDSTKEKLRIYRLMNKQGVNRVIPKDYLYNSLEVRIALLQGLMDVGSVLKSNGVISYTTNSNSLAESIKELVLSLGGSARIFQHSELNTIEFTLNNNISPFKLSGKIDDYCKSEKHIEQKYVKSIEYSHEELAVCIKVSNPDELFVTRDYVLTHNTTILTKIANTAFNMGYNVLQIFFEDNPKIVQRKHFTIWTGIEPDNLVKHKDEVMKKITEIKETMPNKLILKKLASDTMTMSQIKNQVRKMIADGTKIDMVLLDYIDCVLPESSSKDEWKAEGSVMRGFEAMCHELDLAGWTATQGNRSSISSEVVTTDQMGGSIKKAQVGHVIITVAKTLTQKEMNLATIAITKSRLGKDGVVFENCKFNNELLEIDTESSVTFLGFEEQQEERKRDRVKELLEKRKAREQQQK